MVRGKFGQVVSKRAVLGNSTTQEGKRVRAGTRIMNEDGEVRTLLTPAGKGAKYAQELREDKHYTNDGAVKKYLGGSKEGRVKKLTPKERAYRAGYLDARKDSANAFKSKKKGGK